MLKKNLSLLFFLLLCQTTMEATSGGQMWTQVEPHTIALSRSLLLTSLLFSHRLWETWERGLTRSRSRAPSLILRLDHPPSKEPCAASGLDGVVGTTFAVIISLSFNSSLKKSSTVWTVKTQRIFKSSLRLIIINLCPVLHVNTLCSSLICYYSDFARLLFFFVFLFCLFSIWVFRTWINTKHFYIQSHPQFWPPQLPYLTDLIRIITAFRSLGSFIHLCSSSSY